MKKILLLSGGIDSVGTLFWMLKNKQKPDHILFCNTGLEFPENLLYIYELDAFLQEKYGLFIETIKPADNPEYYFFKKKKRNGKMGYGVPYIPMKWCKKKLKIEPVDDWLRTNNIREAELIFGFNKCEYHRLATTMKRYERLKHTNYIVKAPAFENSLNREDLIKIIDKEFAINPLYEHYIRVACFCCPYGGIKHFITLYRTHKKLFEQCRLWENKSIRKTRKGFLKEIKLSTLNKVLKTEDILREQGRII